MAVQLIAISYGSLANPSLAIAPIAECSLGREACMLNSCKHFDPGSICNQLHTESQIKFDLSMEQYYKAGNGIENSFRVGLWT